MWDASTYAFAKAFQARMPALRRFHTTTVCKLLADAGIATDRWHSADALLEAIERGIRSAGGWRYADPVQQRNPLAYTAHMLRTTIDPFAETPFEASRRRRAELSAEQARNRAEAAEARARAKADGGRAAQEFFEAQKRLYGAGRVQVGRDPGSNSKQLVSALLGSERPLYAQPSRVQLLVGDVQNLHRHLKANGWQVSAAVHGSAEVTWCHPNDEGSDLISFTLHVEDGRARVSSDVELDDIVHSPGFPADLLKQLVGGS